MNPLPGIAARPRVEPKGVLETSRLVLRRYAQSDAPLLHNLIISNRSRLSQFVYTVSGSSTFENAERFVSHLIEEWEAHACFTYGIYQRESGNLIGHFFIESIEWQVPKCELGYLIDQQETGKGYATEALNSVTDYCLHSLAMARVFLRISTTNTGSLKVAEKAGYTREGVCAMIGRHSMANF